MWQTRSLGHGVGLRLTHYGDILEHGPRGVDWMEAISENFMEMGGRPWEVLQRVRSEVEVVLHGVSLGIGNVDPLNRDYLKQLKALRDAIQPAWISDHLCWGGYGGHYAHDLLPLPYTEETIAHIVPRIQEVQEFLGCRMVFENVSSYVAFRQSEMEEWEFVVEIAKRSGCGLLVDVNNIYVSAFNHGFQVEDYLDAIPPEYVAQFHIAGHTDKDGYKLDTHIGPIIPEVWDVYRMALRRFGRVSALIEWDEDVPAYDEVLEESRRARAIEQEVLDAAEGSRASAEKVLGVHHRTKGGGAGDPDDAGARS